MTNQAPQWAQLIINELKRRRQKEKDDQEGRLPEYTDKTIT